MNVFKLGLNGAFILRKYGIRVVREEEVLTREARRQKREFLGARKNGRSV
jgi:hypothetical protein